MTLPGDDGRKEEEEEELRMRGKWEERREGRKRVRDGGKEESCDERKEGRRKRVERRE